MQGDPHSVGDILDALHGIGDRQAEVAVTDILESMGHRSYGPVLLIPALIEITPIGAIPGLPTFLALIIAIGAVQMLLGRRNLWLPGFIGRRHVSGKKLQAASTRLRGLARFMDRHFHRRLRRLTGATWRRLAAVIVILLCCTVPPLELVPFASTGPMLAIAAFGLAILVRDGLLMAVALALSLGTAVLGIVLLASGGGA